MKYWFFHGGTLISWFLIITKKLGSIISNTFYTLNNQGPFSLLISKQTATKLPTIPGGQVIKQSKKHLISPFHTKIKYIPEN